MKSVGEAMAIGRTFKEALQKGIRSLEIGAVRLRPQGRSSDGTDQRRRCSRPTPDRLFYVQRGPRRGLRPSQEIYRADRRSIPGSSTRSQQIVRPGAGDAGRRRGHWRDRHRRACAEAKRAGFSDRQLAAAARARPADGADPRARADRRPGITPVYKRVDTCAAEFEAHTPYLYSTYETECEAEPTDRQEGHDPGRRAQPHRPGHRVRLLLLPRRVRAARDWATRPSWSTATPRPSPPTTTPPTGSTSSR